MFDGDIGAFERVLQLSDIPPTRAHKWAPVSPGRGSYETVSRGEETAAHFTLTGPWQFESLSSPRFFCSIGPRHRPIQMPRSRHQAGFRGLRM